MQNRPILIMAGGTGGHVYPALAIADYLHNSGIHLLWLGSNAGLESRLVPDRGYSLITMQVSGLRGKGIVRWLSAPFTLFTAVIRALRILRSIKPAAVLGMGGFVSGPGGIAAWCLRIPLCIHEQNAICGLTNRILAHLADRVMAAFPGVFPDQLPLSVTGNPVRTEILAISPPEERLKNKSTESLNILILGGSQGARTLNRLVPETLSKLPTSMTLNIRHQAGPRLYEETAGFYRGNNNRAEILPYIEDMADAYAWSDLVICRAGALTIAELTMAGVAAILIPFPYAVDDHQTANARYMVDAGAAICIQESDINHALLGDQIQDFYQNRDRLFDMSCRARKLARPTATEDVATICMELAYGR